MKRLAFNIISLLFFISNISQAQINDMVNHIGDECIDMKELDHFKFQFANDSIYIGAEILMNCNPNNYLFREIREDSIFLVAADTANAYCNCIFELETRFYDMGYDSYYVSIGYSALATGYDNYRHDLDTVIYRPEVGLSQIKESSPILLFPNPVNEQLHIYLSEPNDFLQSIMVYHSSGRVVIEEVFQSIEKEKQIDLSKLAIGIYMVKIKSKNTELMEKILKI